MANTVNCSIVGQKSRGGSTYAATAVYMGYGNGSTHYEYVLSFTTGDFVGKSKSITFNIKMGNGSQGASRTYRWALLNSDSSVVGRETSVNLYFDKHVEVTDPNQLAQGTVTWSDMNKDTHKVLTIETTELKENTNYFLVLWAYSTNPTSFVTVSNTQYHGDIIVEYYRAYNLSISQGNGSTITVNNGSTILTDGATITEGDVLTISFGVSTGYNLGTHTVNGSTFTSGDSHTVTSDVSVVSTASLKTFKLSISAGTGSTITVKRSGTALSNGATITYGDVLTINFGASTGYNLTKHTVNDSSFTSGGTHTVTDNVSVAATASLKTFKLYISAGAGTTITVKRSGTELSDGATITYGDVLVTTFSAQTGYELSSTSHNNGGSYTVTKDVSVSATATVLFYTLSISEGDGTHITVERTNSPKQGAATGLLGDGETIYHSDVLTISFGADAGYKLDTNTVNGSKFTSGNKHAVVSDVSVVAIATQQGLIYIHNGTAYKKYLVYIDDGSKWVQCIPYVDNGSSWNLCN